MVITMIPPADPDNKGKQRALSVDLSSPRDPTPPISKEMDESPEEPKKEEEEDEGPPLRKATPMPGTWGEDLEARALPAQMTDIVQINPRDFGEALPEQGQLPKMTNAEARELFRTEPPGTTPTITKAVLRTTIGVNPSFVPSFRKPSLLQL